MLLQGLSPWGGDTGASHHELHGVHSLTHWLGNNKAQRHKVLSCPSYCTDLLPAMRSDEMNVIWFLLMQEPYHIGWFMWNLLVSPRFSTSNSGWEAEPRSCTFRDFASQGGCPEAGETIFLKEKPHNLWKIRAIPPGTYSLSVGGSKGPKCPTAPKWLCEGWHTGSGEAPGTKQQEKVC